MEAEKHFWHKHTPSPGLDISHSTIFEATPNTVTCERKTHKGQPEGEKEDPGIYRPIRLTSIIPGKILKQ